MINLNQNQEVDYQNFQNYQNNNQNYQVINPNNSNHTPDNYYINPSENPPKPENNVNDLPTEQLVNSQAPLLNNNQNYTPQAPDIYPPLSDQVAPPISNPDMVTDQQMSQPPAEPIYQPNAQQIQFDNVPLVIQPPQPRRRAAVRYLSIFISICCIVGCIIIIVRQFTRYR